MILSFGHEMNGNWYSWGNTNSTPAQFIAAWRHVVTVFRAVGATNVKWLWAVNNFSSETSGQKTVSGDIRITRAPAPAANEEHQEVHA